MTRFVPAVLVLLTWAPAVSAAGPYDDLLKAVPTTTNTLVLINAKAAFASPLAKAEKWEEARKQAGRDGLGFVPRYAEAVVIASEVNFTSMARDHQVGIARVPLAPEMRDLAEREGGTTDRVSGRVVVLSPRDVYFTNLYGFDVTAVYPANRQALARFLRDAAAAKRPSLSPYLARAAAEDATVVIALDLTESVDPAVLQLGLTASPSMARRKDADLGQVARFVAGVQGLTVTIRVTDVITASVRADFRGNPNLYRTTLRDLLVELLDDQGVSVPGFDKWETTYTDTSMTLSGRLTTADLRRILSLFAFPGAVGEDEKAGNEVSVPATQRYLAAVQSILDDVRKMRESDNFAKTATWHEKAADQIDQLNRRAVDPLAADAAFEASKRLRAIAASLRGVPIDTEALARKAYYYARPNYGVGLSWWGRPSLFIGPAQVDTNYLQIRAEQAKVVADDQKRRAEAWNQIDQILSEARRKLTDKHKTPF